MKAKWTAVEHTSNDSTGERTIKVFTEGFDRVLIGQDAINKIREVGAPNVAGLGPLEVWEEELTGEPIIVTVWDDLREEITEWVVKPEGENEYE